MLLVKLTLERLDKDYRLLERREQRSRSFLKNFISLLYCAHAQITAAAPFTMSDITNTARTVDSQGVDVSQRYSKANLRMAAPPGVSGIYCTYGYTAGRPNQTTIEGDKLGIIVGTGTTAVTPTDVALVARVAHGRATGQLEYGGCELINIAFVAPNGEFTIRRYFTNASGGSITINEIGIYSVGTDFDTYYAWPFCVARDIVSPGIAVANTELLRVTYVPQITV